MINNTKWLVQDLFLSLNPFTLFNIITLKFTKQTGTNIVDLSWIQFFRAAHGMQCCCSLEWWGTQFHNACYKGQYRFRFQYSQCQFTCKTKSFWHGKVKNNKKVSHPLFCFPVWKMIRKFILANLSTCILNILVTSFCIILWMLTLSLIYSSMLLPFI